ncbi:MAG TPA: phosphoglucosamine mutase [Blastocatellia bacterium]|nr:phosphoglucosamine mutase [Blastocatellia bacterium]
MSGGAEQRLFGTDGVRGIAGQYPLDERTVEIIGRSIVSNLARELGRAPSIVIGRDTRESGPKIEAALASGAIAAGASVESAGVITTPGIAYLTRSVPFDAGIVISASHNPYQDNGIKVFSPSGKKLADEVERRIEAEVTSTQSAESPNALADNQHQSHYQEKYLDYLANEITRGLTLKDLRIALDCAHGAASSIAPILFERLGAGIKVLAAQPDGRNINEGCGSLHLEALQKVVAEERFDLGIAFDGDADRALFVDSGGNLVDGDATLMILADYLKGKGHLRGDVVIATVMSNIGLELALRERGIELVRTQVGDRYVLEEILVRGAKLGGEQSGHIIFPDISLAGDGLITAIELLRVIKESGLTLDSLSSKMTHYPQILINVRVRSKPPIDTLTTVRSEVERVEEELEGNGRLLVRYSGTENLARVMIEGQDEAKIKEQANKIVEALRNEIGE